MKASNTFYTVLRKFSFEAAHQLPGHPTCGVIHGHSFKGEIKITANQLTTEGFVADFGDLKAITAKYDHGELLTKTVETLAEELGAAVLKQLSEQNNRQGVLQVCVTIWETENSCAEWVWHV